MNVKVGWVGNFYRESKRFDIALKVAEELKTTLKIAGPPNSLYYIEHSNMPDFYRSLDCLLVTSEAEAHPLVVYEALACGVPVVMPEGIGDCSTKHAGIIFYRPNSHPKLIGYIIKALIDYKKDFAEEAVNTILKHWQWKYLIPDYFNMFKTITNKDDGLKIAIIIDSPGWAWDFMAHEMQTEFMKTGKCTLVDIIYANQTKPKDINFESYDAILNHCWWNYNSLMEPMVRSDRNIVCCNGPAYKEPEARRILNILVKRGTPLTSVSFPIVKDLKAVYPKSLVFHCSRGVDIEKFHP
jgi:hypothetical protein